MKYLVRTLFSSLFIGCFLVNLSAQNSSDFGVWTGLGLNQKIVKNLDASFRGQVRLDGNANYFKSCFFNGALSYKFHKMVSVLAGYRFTIRPERNNHRAYLDVKLNYRKKEWRTTFKLRLRGQYDTSNDHTLTPSTTLRPRLYVGYKPKGKFIKRFTFYVTGEIFYEFIQSYSSLNKYRVSAGLDFKLSKKIDVGLRYIFQNDLNIPAAVQDHILSIGLGVDLPKLKFKKKGKKKDKKKEKD